ncbi:MAG: hypothetical protein IT439_07455 [Phycisphaerales bacterium]|nr:hypothetical protein [Phycisphaerales bacterium]
MTHTRRSWMNLLGACAAGVLCLPAAGAADRVEDGGRAPKVLQLPIRTDGPKSLDPVEGSTTYDNMACVQVYETLLEGAYWNPREMEPRLLAEMPTSDDGGKTWNFKLKPGVVFYDPSPNPCFGGKPTRPIRTDDVFYSLKRLADKKYTYENYWLIEGAVEGLDEFKATQANNAACDYDAPVSGFIKISDSEFQIRLTKPVYRFLYVLSMFQTSIVAREAVEHYGAAFDETPVGTGPFAVERFVQKQSLSLVRNPYYHEVFYPERDKWSDEDRRLRMHRPAGERVPFVDRIEFTMFVEDQPMWLQFDAGNIAYTEVPAEYFEKAFNKRTKELLPEMRERGIRAHNDLLLDFIFRGFNMEDPVVGGYSERAKALRQAINLAMDLNEFNETFYNGLNFVYDGPIPPGLDGYPPDGMAPHSYRGPNLELARQKLAEAGYPNGQGLAPLQFYTSKGSNNAEQLDLMKRQLARIGVRIDGQLVDFSTLIEAVNKKKAPFFSFAWSSDYPDAENNLALFYGPNEAPGANHYNYKRPEYDAMYEQIRVMPPSDERTAIYERMRDMLIEDAPFVGSMARVRYYLVAPWALNLRPTERHWSWFKYVDVDDSKRP